jgi:hypothetical protein
MRRITNGATHAQSAINRVLVIGAHLVALLVLLTITHPDVQSHLLRVPAR